MSSRLPYLRQIALLGLNVLWQVVDIEQEEERLENRTLRYTSCQRDF